MSSEVAKIGESDNDVAEALRLLNLAMKILDDVGFDVPAAHVQMAIDCSNEQLNSHANG